MSERRSAVAMTKLDPMLEAFIASMPAAYSRSFDEEALAAHAAIVGRRAGSATRVEIWQHHPDQIVAICIVADDRPGLLAQISAALVTHAIDVVTAHAYCRKRPDGALEAVDLLWIRRALREGAAAAPIHEREVAAIGEMVDALVRGNASFDQAVSFARAVRSASSTRVLFDDSAKDGTMMLTVEATDRPGLLLLVTQAIFRAELQIVGLKATSERGTATDRFHLAELDNRPLLMPRLLALQVEIFRAIEESTAEPEA